MKTLYEHLIKWESGNVQEGDMFRHWIVSLPDGREADRWQRLTRGNPCRITRTQIRADYDTAGKWGPSWDNSCSMSQPVVRVKGTKIFPVPLAAALAILD